MVTSDGSHGFTLIEIIVSVALLLLLSGLFVASYNGFNNTQAVKQAASNLINDLQAVRASATFGVKPTGCDTLLGYQVNFAAAGTSYTSVAFCQVGANEETVGEITTYTLPTGTVFAPVPQSITFYPLDHGASADQTITIVGNNTTAEVSVFSTGVVSDYVPTPTP